MKMLVPVDGSSASLKAVEKSIEIAKKYGFSIKIITAVNFDKAPKYRRNERLWRQVDGSIISGGSMMIEDDEIAVQMRRNAVELLDSIVREFNFSGIEVEKEVMLGEPYMKILEQAREGNFDLIVMGNRGFSRIKRFFLGSVTQRVIAEAACPVLVIHSEADE